LAHDLKIKSQYDEAQEEQREIITGNVKFLGCIIKYWNGSARFQQAARLQEVIRDVNLENA
jgi:hypothetical protein